jgi:hypothetical protein
MDSAPRPQADAPPPEPPPDAKRRRLALIVVAGVVAVALLVALVVTRATNDDGDGDGGSGPATTTSDEQTTGTRTEGSAAGSGEVDSTAPRPADTTTSISSGPAGSDALADGLWIIGEDIQPGRYIAAGIDGNGCDWARLSDAAGNSVIAAETDVANQAIVDILDSDTAFRTTGCGTWARYTAPGRPPATTIDEGDWVVGEQIEAGAYRVPQAATCSWTRATGFEHTPQEVTQTEKTNIALEGPFLVTLTAGERFTSRGCATWARAD